MVSSNSDVFLPVFGMKTLFVGRECPSLRWVSRRRILGWKPFGHSSPTADYPKTPYIRAKYRPAGVLGRDGHYRQFGNSSLRSSGNVLYNHLLGWFSQCYYGVNIAVPHEPEQSTVHGRPASDAHCARVEVSAMIFSH